MNPTCTADNNQPKTGKRLGFLSAMFAFILLAIIWIPEIKHYYVRGSHVTSSMLVLGQQEPSDTVLEEIRAHRLLPRGWKSDEQLVSAAEKLLNGTAEIPGYDPIQIRLPFDASDLDRGSSLWQLQFAGLIVPEVLLDAYQRTGREEFYFLARDVLLAWARYEGNAWLNRGFLWNDHAVAARARTLADFWRIYRHRPDYSLETATTIWRFASRTGELLAKQDQFTFATNHGVMQNLALWQLCLAFPSLPESESHREIALARLADEMSFYVADGVVLEHSAEYHEFGLFLMGLALRYATLLHLDVPADWVGKYESAKEFYAEIRRPNGTLPMFGDTDAEHSGNVSVARPDLHGFTGPLVNSSVWKPRDSFGFYPIAGYAVFWDGLDRWPSTEDLSQTVVTWSSFAGHGHKHADELSLLLWAGGKDWWTNVGYWPYDDVDRHHAECWEGSDAPHLVGESCDSAESSALTSYFHSGKISAVELERRGPGDFLVRRLVVHIPPNIWIIADNASGRGNQVLQTIWTTSADVIVQKGDSAGDFTLSAPGVPEALRVFFFGAPGVQIRTVRGSRFPFGGWTTMGGRPKPTEAIVVEQRVQESWQLIVLAFEDSNRTTYSGAPIVLSASQNARTWDVSLPKGLAYGRISRRDNVISAWPGDRSRASDVTVTLLPPSINLPSGVEALRTTYRRVAPRYPRFRDLQRYRQRASILAMVLFTMQELGVLILRRRGMNALALRIAGLLCWVGVSLWVEFFYLVTG